MRIDLRHSLLDVCAAKHLSDLCVALQLFPVWAFMRDGNAVLLSVVMVTHANLFADTIFYEVRRRGNQSPRANVFLRNYSSHVFEFQI